MATLSRKNPRTGSDENDLDDERRGNMSVNKSIDRVDGPFRREMKKVIACIENKGTEAMRIMAIVYITLASRVCGSEIRAFNSIKTTIFKTIY